MYTINDLSKMTGKNLESVRRNIRRWGVEVNGYYEISEAQAIDYLARAATIKENQNKSRATLWTSRQWHGFPEEMTDQEWRSVRIHFRYLVAPI